MTREQVVDDEKELGTRRRQRRVRGKEKEKVRMIPGAM